jgi:hypothetical protein
MNNLWAISNLGGYEMIAKLMQPEMLVILGLVTVFVLLFLHAIHKLSSAIGVNVEVKSPPPKDKSSWPKYIFIMLLVGAAYLFIKADLFTIFLTTQMTSPEAGVTIAIGGTATAKSASHRYDSDDGNDAYIKSGLSAQQLATLDAILRKEYNEGGLRLRNNDVVALANGDGAVVKAYGRWRRCRDLMRSGSDVIYPK